MAQDTGVPELHDRKDTKQTAEPANQRAGDLCAGVCELHPLVSARNGYSNQFPDGTAHVPTRKKRDGCGGCRLGHSLILGPKIPVQCVRCYWMEWLLAAL